MALALLTAPPEDALGSLPGIRRGLLAAGNPLSAVFWTSAEAILHKINDGVATVGDVRTWLEATGTEPNGIIGLHVWDEMSERSQLAAEMHTRLVSHLEERLAAGETDPDLLAAADPAACQAYIELQERWMTSALPDGRVPMDVLLDEKDEEFLAEWDAADADALAATRGLLDRVGERPLPTEDLRRASARLRQDIARPGWPGALLIECSGLRPDELPADDTELWLRLAAGVASPQGTDDWGAPDAGDGDSDEAESELATICAIDHFDWLAAITALAEGGPGTAASAADLAGYVRDYDPEDPEDPDGGEPAETDEPAERTDETRQLLPLRRRRVRRSHHGKPVPARDLAVAGARRDRRRRAADRAGLVGPARGHAPGLGPVRWRAGLGQRPAVTPVRIQLPVRAVVRRQMAGPFGWKDPPPSRPARCHGWGSPPRRPG